MCMYYSVCAWMHVCVCLCVCVCSFPSMWSMSRAIDTHVYVCMQLWEVFQSSTHHEMCVKGYSLSDGLCDLWGMYKINKLVHIICTLTTVVSRSLID